MRKTTDGVPVSDEPIEIVVDKVKDIAISNSSPATTPKPTHKKSGMQLPKSKPKIEPDEINWDDITGNKFVEEEKSKSSDAGGWGRE